MTMAQIADGEHDLKSSVQEVENENRRVTVCGPESPGIAVEVAASGGPPLTRTTKAGFSILAQDDLTEWDALVEASPQCSVFFKSWWLKAACGEAHVLGYFEGGRLVAGIPLHYERRAGLRVCGMPKLTQTWGIVMPQFSGKQVTVESRATEILDIFATRLAQEPVFVQSFHPAVQNWLPFYWRGYSQTTLYTYILDDLQSTDRLWNGMAQVRRTNIRKARKLNIHVKECGPDTVYQAAAATFGQQGRKCMYSLEYLRSLYEAARANGAGACFAAEDRGGRVHAATFFVWDKKRGYHLAAGHDPALGSSCGPVLLMWELIERAASCTEVFDFEGSMRREVEASYRSFGAKRVAYHRIFRSPFWLQAGLRALGRHSL